MTAVYPKEDPEYKKLVRELLYKQVRNTKWNDVESSTSKPRGRKPKSTTRIESKPRTASEEQASKQKYTWFK